MNEEYEEIEILRMRAEEERLVNAGWPIVGRPAQEALEEGQRRLIHWKSCWRELMDLAGKKTYRVDNFIFDAGNIWREAQSTYGTWTEQTLEVFRRKLIARNLITGEDVKAARAIQIRYVDPAKDAAAREEAARLREFDQAIQKVLGFVELRYRQDALAVYNSIDEPRSEQKINRWIKSLIEVKLLPAEFLGGLRVGEFFQKLKAMVPNYQNKMVDPREANK